MLVNLWQLFWTGKCFLLQLFKANSLTVDALQEILTNYPHNVLLYSCALVHCPYHLARNLRSGSPPGLLNLRSMAIAFAVAPGP